MQRYNKGHKWTASLCPFNPAGKEDTGMLSICVMQNTQLASRTKRTG